MPLELAPYQEQAARWPSEGRRILAQYDAASVVVYQAYRPEIGRFAALHGYFGGGFGLGRMSWIKPGFLWMMHRSNWGTSEGQTVVLAVRITRPAFDAILAQAVLATYEPVIHGDENAWKDALGRSSVRVQWDPDYDPRDARLPRRAIQIGLRGQVLAQYARQWIVGIEDISPLVASLRQQVQNAHDSTELLTPTEHEYPVADDQVARRLGLHENTWSLP